MNATKHTCRQFYYKKSNGLLGGDRILDNFIVGESGSRERGTRRWGCCAFRRARIGLSPFSPPSPTTKARHNSGPRTRRFALLGFALAALRYRLLTRGFALPSSHSLAAFCHN